MIVGSLYSMMSLANKLVWVPTLWEKICCVRCFLIIRGPSLYLSCCIYEDYMPLFSNNGRLRGHGLSLSPGSLLFIYFCLDCHVGYLWSYIWCLSHGDFLDISSKSFHYFTQILSFLPKLFQLSSIVSRQSHYRAISLMNSFCFQWSWLVILASS